MSGPNDRSDDISEDLVPKPRVPLRKHDGQEALNKRQGRYFDNALAGEAAKPIGEPSTRRMLANEINVKAIAEALPSHLKNIEQDHVQRSSSDLSNESKTASFNEFSSGKLQDYLDHLAKDILTLSAVARPPAVLEGTRIAFVKLFTMLQQEEEGLTFQAGKNTQDLMNSLEIFKNSENAHPPIKLALLISMQDKIEKAIPEIKQGIKAELMMDSPNSHTRQNVRGSSSPGLSGSQQPILYLSNPVPSNKRQYKGR